MRHEAATKSMSVGELFKRFLLTPRASSAVEFALIFPTLLILMLMGIQVVTYVNAARKVELLAASISEMISQAAPPSSSTTVATVNAADLHFSYDSGLVIFPFLMKDAARQNILWFQDIIIDYASVQFTPIPGANCTSKPDLSTCFIANVVWTSSGTNGTNYRPCVIPQLAASNTSAPNNKTLPAGIFGPNSIIVVDVVFTFTPTFGSQYLPAMRISRSTYVKPRYATLISFNTANNDGIAQQCP